METLYDQSFVFLLWHNGHAESVMASEENDNLFTPLYCLLIDKSPTSLELPFDETIPSKG